MQIIISLSIYACMVGLVFTALYLLKVKRSLERQLYEAYKHYCRIEDEYGAMETNELFEVLAVGRDEPWLRAVCHILHKNSLIQAEMAGSPALDSEISKGHAMAAVAIEDCSDELIRLTEKALRARAGQKEDLSEA